MKKILLLPGDGIGPEVIAEGEKVLRWIDALFSLGLEFETGLLGGVAIDATGEPCPAETLEQARAAEAVLLGAVGGPKWDNVDRSIRLRKVY